MGKITLLKFYSVVSFCLVSHIAKIEAQIVIGTPDLQFSQACANESFNSFTATFVFSPESGVASSNEFIVEMSDPNGSFSAPEIVFTSNPGAINASPATIDFSLPTTTAGEGYKIRIKSTQPATISAQSASFAAYYKIQDSPFTINNLIGTANFCPGGSYLLTIDNPGTGANVSPLNYPSLSFNWFKEVTTTSSILVGQGPTLSVTEEGVYFVETNYGSCTSDSFSNRVLVSEATSGELVMVSIISSLGNPFCASDGPTTLSTVTGNSYKWYKDGNIIPGETSQTYKTNSSGVYSVRIDFGSCEATGSIELQTGDFSSSLNVQNINLLESGEILTVIVTTNAVNPEFMWFLNNEEIPNATQNTFDATDFGNYKVIVTQTFGCVVINELNFEINELIDLFPEVEFIPNLISPNGDGINDTWIIPTSYIIGSKTEIVILSNQGETVLQTNDYMNDWPEGEVSSSSVNQVYYYIIMPKDQPPKKGSITIIK